MDAFVIANHIGRYGGMNEQFNRVQRQKKKKKSNGSGPFSVLKFFKGT